MNQTDIMKKLVLFCFMITFSGIAQSQDTLKIFISADMEGVGGIGTSQMTRNNGKDYTLGRELMTAEVNAVVAAILESGPAEIVVNDSHGDMQNLLHTELDPEVSYIQSNIKPLGMVQGLDASFDAVVLLGYHARAGTENAFLAHTGAGKVKGLWINGTEVGEGGLNLYFAGSLDVPVILASGDLEFTRQIRELVPVRTVATKEAIGYSAAKLVHPDKVNEALRFEVKEALQEIPKAQSFHVDEPVSFTMQLSTPGQADIVMGIPGMQRKNAYSVSYDAPDMDTAYRLIRIIYKYIQ